MCARALGLSTLLLAVLPGVAQAEPGERLGEASAELDRASVPAKARDKLRLTVKSFGRFAITAKSKPGVALQLVDVSRGPGEVAGKPGELDGRIDTFLDRGTYRVLTHGAARAKGSATVEVHAYRELNGPKPPELVELKPIDAVLQDFEQRSYWIDVRAARSVVLEAAGRNLADLRLWREGTWLLDATPSRSEVTPKVGRPLDVLRLHAELEPGLYLLTAYGGPSKAWAEDDGRHPFHLRFGVPALPSAGRKRLTVGPFGYDRWVVPAATYFRVELAEARPVTMELRTWGSGSPFFASLDATASIQKNTNPPVAEVRVSRSNSPRLVTVTGTEGQAYVLQHFQAEHYRDLASGGPYWVSTIHAGYPEDNVDATGVITDIRTPNVVLAAQGVELDSDHRWSRCFNLLDQATVYFDVREAGSYVVGATGTKATFRFEPMLINRPPEYKVPPFEAPGKAWQLDRGLWVLTIQPTEKGIVEVNVVRKGLFGAPSAKGAPALPRGGLRFPSLSLPWGHILYLGHQPGVETGVILRKLPLDLADPLFVTQSPGEVVKVPFRAAEAGTLTAEAEDGVMLELAVDGGAPARSVKVTPGDHSVSISWTGAHLALYSLALAPHRLAPDTALPPLPDTRLATLPELPVLKDRSPSALDLDRGSSATYLVRAASPALYRLETTGLLATEGKLRTRTITALSSAAEDGVGRNFLLQQYLGTGDYQVTVTTRGLTKGHLGLSLQATPMADGGALELGVPARASLPSGTAITYPFEVKSEGRHHLRAIGVDRTLRCRLEDDEGWPLLEPGGKCDLTRSFEAGKYRLIVLPEAVDLRVVTILERETKAPSFKGKGPHALPLDHRVSHRFLEQKASEKANSEARRPDVWEVTLPAPGEVEIELTAKLQGELILLRADGTREKAGYLPPLRGFQGRLAAGKYRLEVMPLTESSDVPYAIAVRPRPLMTGMERQLQVPARVAVSVGEDSLIELSSFGTSDVRARLLDASGRTVLHNDDRPDDWNFHLAQRLVPGDYELVLDPVGARRGKSVVTMKRRVEELAAPLALPVRQKLEVGKNVKVFPVEVPAGNGLFIVAARSPETLGLVLEAEASGASKVGPTWRTLASSVGRPAHVEVPLDASRSRKLRIRLWSVDERSLPADLRAVALAPAKVTEAELARGARVESAGVGLAIGALELALERPGTFAIGGHDEALVRWSAVVESAAAEAVHGKLSARGRSVWLVKDLAGGTPSTLRAERVRVDPGAPVMVELQPGRSLTLDAQRHSGQGGPLLLEARSRRAQPGVAILDGTGRRLARASAASFGVAVAVSLEDRRDAAADLWAAGDAADPFDVTLSAHGFPAPPATTITHGTSGGALPPRSARRLQLPAGAKRLRLALDEGVVATLSDGAVVRRTHLAKGEEETFEGTDGAVTLLNPLEHEARWSLELMPLAAAALERSLTLDAPYEANHPRAGSVTLQLPPGAGRATLRVRGERASAQYTGASGMIARGTELQLDGEGGTVLLSHGPGVVLAWLEGQDGRDGLFGKGAPAPSPVSVPGAFPLGGRGAAFSLRASAPAIIHAVTEVPVVLRWTRPGVRPRVELYPAGALASLFLPAGGTGELALRPLGRELLQGSVELTSTEVLAIREGLGPEVTLSPGTERVFSFQVKEAGEVGLGVRSQAPDVEGTLLDANGNELGRGVIQMHTLATGSYLLALRAPETGGPVTARPALAGVERPSRAPPEDVVRGYVMAEDPE